MATIVSKTIPGENGEYGPYYYYVYWTEDEQHWKYIGRVDEINNPHEAAENATREDDEHEWHGTDDDGTAGGSSPSGEMPNPIEKPAERMEQLLDEKGIDAEVIEREAEGRSSKEAYIIDFEDQEEFEKYFEHVDDSEFVYPEFQSGKLDKWRTDDEEYDTTIVMPPAAIHESTLPTGQYDDDPSGGSDVVKIEEFDRQSQGKVFVDVDYEHKDILKSVREADASWDGARWKIDVDAIDDVEDRFEDEDIDLRLSSTAKAWRDAEKD